MYDVEKRSDNLENVAGFAKRDVYMHGPVAEWFGVCLYIGETNVAFPQTLYRSECHWHSFLRGAC